MICCKPIWSGTPLRFRGLCSKDDGHDGTCASDEMFAEVMMADESPAAEPGNDQEFHVRVLLDGFRRRPVV